jgi:hypothetical protein
MMKVENNEIFFGKKIIRRDLIMMNKMASKNKTFRKIEELRIALLIMDDIIKLFICIESAFDKCK